MRRRRDVFLQKISYNYDVLVSDLDARRPLRRGGESWTANVVLSWEALSFGTVSAERAARAERARAEAMQRYGAQQVRLEVREAALTEAEGRYLRALHGSRVGLARLELAVGKELRQ